jgi:hypothetical protein
MTRSAQLLSLIIVLLMTFALFYLPPILLFKIVPAAGSFLKEFFIWNTLLLILGCVVFVKHEYNLMNGLYVAKKTVDVKHDDPETGDKIN